MNKKDICSYNYDELKEEMLAIGEKAFRSKQIYEWLHVKLADDFDEMTNLSKGLREKLKENYEIRKVKMIDHQISKVDPTEKFLFELEDGNMVESVLMKYKHGNSVCISSQVGCRMGCRFCASTLDGLERNLTPSEMLRQVYQIQKITGERVSNIVIMGTGEPLDNYDNVRRFLELVNSPEGLNIGMRHISLSTCGLVDQIDRLAPLTSTLPPEKYHGVYLWDCTEHPETCRRKAADHAGTFPARFQPGKEEIADAGGK